jgi:hypothetical protein
MAYPTPESPDQPAPAFSEARRKRVETAPRLARSADRHFAAQQSLYFRELKAGQLILDADPNAMLGSQGETVPVNFVRRDVEGSFAKGIKEILQGAVEL